MLHEVDKVKENVFVYLIFFIHKQSKTIVLLAEEANIESICYNDNPTLPGTIFPAKAKKYKSIEEAKKDIYKLRYHHREFLKIVTGIKCMSKEDLEIALLTTTYCSNYKLDDLT